MLISDKLRQLDQEKENNNAKVDKSLPEIVVPTEEFEVAGKPLGDGYSAPTTPQRGWMGGRETLTRIQDGASAGNERIPG